MPFIVIVKFVNIFLTGFRCFLGCGFWLLVYRRCYLRLGSWLILLLRILLILFWWWWDSRNISSMNSVRTRCNRSVRSITNSTINICSSWLRKEITNNFLFNIYTCFRSCSNCSTSELHLSNIICNNFIVKSSSQKEDKSEFHNPTSRFYYGLITSRDFYLAFD